VRVAAAADELDDAADDADADEDDDDVILEMFRVYCRKQTYKSVTCRDSAV